MQPGATPSRLLPGLGLMTFAVYETERSRKVAPSPKLLEIVFGAHLRCPTARHASFVDLPGSRRCCSRACFGQMQPGTLLSPDSGLRAWDLCQTLRVTFAVDGTARSRKAGTDPSPRLLEIMFGARLRCPTAPHAACQRRTGQPSNAHAHSSEPTCSLQSCATSSPLGTLSSCGRR